MSATVAIFRVPENIEGYDQIIQELEAAGASNPKGQLYHVAAATPDGYLVVDVWETPELLDQFSEILVPIIKKLGGTPAQPEIYPVHNIMP